MDSDGQKRNEPRGRHDREHPVSAPEAFRYDGKRVLVVGGASGMGAAAARTAAGLGATLHVLDHAPIDYEVAQAIGVDLRDPKAVDAALDQLDGVAIDAIFSAAGVADGTPGLMKINFIAHRHIIERLVASGQLGRGSAVCMISSVGGLGWERQMPMLLEFLATPDFESAVAWVDDHEGCDSYGFSKQVMNCYVASQAFPFMQKGVRINAICPGPTDTPLARANADEWLAFAQDYRDAIVSDHLTADQMGDVMVFLNSAAASGISGVNLLVDSGHVMSSLTGSWAAGTELIRSMMGFEPLA
jgi:NAD(P)-dependent dehydrogenase (short-subunit alcohol dehydrogenase family)